jgi:cell division protein ZapA (FtsZ GTPase activity inhibitor)
VTAASEGAVPGPPARVELKLLGQSLTVRTDVPAEYLRSLAAYVEERVGTMQRSGVRDQTTALLLAALDIVDELFRTREERTRGEHDVRTRLDALVALLESSGDPDIACRPSTRGSAHGDPGRASTPDTSS